MTPKHTYDIYAFDSFRVSSFESTLCILRTDAVSAQMVVAVHSSLLLGEKLYPGSVLGIAFIIMGLYAVGHVDISPEHVSYFY